MAASVKIEFDDGSRVISQTLEDAAGVADAGGNAVVLGDKRPASCSMDDYYEASQPAPPTEPDDPEGWKLGGLPDDPTSDEFKRRNKHPGSDKISLTPTLLTQLPQLNKSGLYVARDFVRGKTKSLPFTFFEKAFPTEAQDIILGRPRHRKKVTRGFSSVPSKEKPDGTKVYGFERMHLFGVIGILLTAHLTQKRRLADHWGTGIHDDYILVRSCMPRDLFMLFYSCFFHMAPTTTPLSKDNADYDSKHPCREFEDVLNWAAINNAYLLFARWAKVLLTQCKEVLVKRGVSDSGGAAIESGCESFCAGPGGAVTNGEDLSVEELTDMCTLLKKMLAMERTVWDRRLSTHLMSLCQLGNLKSGARRTTPVVASYDSKGARSVRVCLGGTCSKPTSENRKYKSARTTGVCWCNVCSNNQGKARALHLCKKCKNIDSAHVAAAACVDGPAAQGQTKAPYRPVDWRN